MYHHRGQRTHGYKAVLEAPGGGCPTKKGLCLRPLEYIDVKELIPEIGRVLSELEGVVPCYVQSDHMNQLGAFRCSESNRNDYENW